MIFRQIALPATDSLLVEFDWLANGESSSYGSLYDYGRAVMAPAAVELSISSNSLQLNGTTLSYDACPAGAIDLVDETDYAMVNQTVAQHVATKLENVEAGLYKIIFGWRNDSSGGTQYPLSICNLSVKILDPAPFGPTGMDNLNGADAVKAEKVLINGKVYILRAGQIFSIMGQSVDHVK